MTKGAHIRVHVAVLVAVAAVALSLLPCPARAQIVHGQRPEVTQGLTFLSWDVTGDTAFTIQEWHVPIVARAGLAENVELSVSGGLLNASADWNLPDDAIDGLTDSKIQVAASLMDDQLLISGGVSLPTGKKELNRDEQALLAWLTSDFLNFPIKSPGEGLNLYGQIGIAAPAGEWVVGASAAFYLAGKYKPYAGTRDYQPGSRFTADLGAQRQWTSGNRVEGDVVFTAATDDKLDGKAVFRDGIQVDSRVMTTLALGKSRLEAGVRAILRGKDKQPGTGDVLISELNNRHGNDLRFHLGGRSPLGHALGAWVSFDAKFLAANGYKKGLPFSEDKAHLSGFGGGLDFTLSERTKAGIGLQGWTGSSDGALGVDNLKFSGLQVSQYFTVTF
jgi:hypothetical protein